MERWRVRHNHERNEIVGREDIVRFIKSSKLRWIGHVERIKTYKIQEKIMNSKYNWSKGEREDGQE